MSFRINTNIAALGALSNLSATSDMFNQSITRLSTGLRINSAADDAAGLIISEKYKSQLAGIDSAVSNSQDAVNYAKTADGALGEVNNLLRVARGLAVSSANTGALSASAIQANQTQIVSIMSSITRIAGSTQFGAKQLLDGTSGVQASVTDGVHVGTVNIGGVFGGAAIAANSGVTITVSTAATQASVTGKTVAIGAAVGAGSFSINGVTFNTSATTTAQQAIDMVNQAQGQTGVVATHNGTAIIFNTVGFGANSTINLTDANGVVRVGGAAGTSSAAGVDAVATVTVNGVSALFTGGVAGRDGLSLSDADGNHITLTGAGNTTGAAMQNATIGQVLIGSSQFQIGANAGQTAQLSIGNFAASQLGGGAVAGLTLANLDVTTAAGATNALKVIDAAIDQVSSARGSIGSFQANVLQSNIRSLGIAKVNLSATESTLVDTDVAAEMTNFTKLQILQSAGMSVLAQANQMPQSVLKLLG